MAARLVTRLAVLLALPAVLAAQDARRDELSRALERLARTEHIQGVPPADSVSAGARVIPVGTVVNSTVVARGPVDVYGQVTGSVVSLAGNVVVHRGASVTGDVLAIGGRVNADSGIVGGEMRSAASLAEPAPGALVAVDVRSPVERTIDSVKNVAGSFVILLIIAAGVALFAGPNLAEVVTTIEGQFARAFWYGLLGQLAALPALLVLVVALALSLIGILLIPFAIVAYVIAVAGLVTLGFLATARLVGGAVVRSDATPARGATLLAVYAGVAMFFLLWAVAALLAWAPLAATVIRAAALAATWVAVTLGLGATLISRAGTHRKLVSGRRPLEIASWQTPTPVAGVVAARRTAGARDSR